MGGGGGELEGGGAKILRPIVVGGGGNFFLAYIFGGAIFLTHYFANFFRESDITCIITVMGAQQQHKGMFLKPGGGGRQKLSNSVIGGAIFSRVFARGGRGAFFFAFQFCRTTPHPPQP